MWYKIISYIPSWITLFQAGLALIIPLGIYYINTSIYSFVGSKGQNPNILLIVRFPTNITKATLINSMNQAPKLQGIMIPTSSRFERL